MKWFDKWFAKKCKQAWEDNRSQPDEGMAINLATAKVSRRESIDANGMNFSVYKANGGYVVEYRQYDRQRDRHDNKLHIVHEDQDLGEALGKIISFEALRS